MSAIIIMRRIFLNWQLLFKPFQQFQPFKPSARTRSNGFNAFVRSGWNGLNGLNAFYSLGEAGKIRDLITTGTAPEEGIRAPMSM